MILSLSSLIIISFAPLPAESDESFFSRKAPLDGEVLNYWVLVPIGLGTTVPISSLSDSSSDKSACSRSSILSTSKSALNPEMREAPRMEFDLKMLWAADMLLIDEPKAVERPFDYEKIDLREGLSNFFSPKSPWLLANTGLYAKISAAEYLGFSSSSLGFAAGLMKVTSSEVEGMQN